MRSESVNEVATLPPDAAQRIDQACDRFEAGWAAGQRPRVEDYLETVPPPERALLLRELILVEVHYRRLAGESSVPEEYLDRFPGLDRAWLTAALAPRPTTRTPLGTPRLPR